MRMPFVVSKARTLVGVFPDPGERDSPEYGAFNEAAAQSGALRGELFLAGDGCTSQAGISRRPEVS